MLARFAPRSTVRVLCRYYSEGSAGESQGPSSCSSSPAPPSEVKDVPGLSSVCIKPATEPVGPGVDPNKSGAYKVPEYYQYHQMTFFEAEVEMAKFRVPQPSALRQPAS